jgi:hypothetical protein
VAYGFGWVAVAAEVAVLEGKVCGYKYFAARRRPQDGAVIAYSQPQSFAVAGGEVASYLFDQREFSYRFGGFFHPDGSINDWQAWLICGRGMVKMTG